MTSLPRFERNLPGILEDLYLGPSPDYRDDLLAAAGRTRQRPAWSFPERWIPVDIANRLAFAPRYPVRAIAIALLVLALIAVGLIVYAGTHPTQVPAPFGPARNGLVAYSVDGDIYVVDPITNESKAILASENLAGHPVFSPDGTRIAFLRRDAGQTANQYDLVVMTSEGGGVKTLSSVPLQQEDVFEWSPDSSYLVVTDSMDRVTRYNVDGSAPTVLISDAHVWLGAFQPPTGDLLIYEPDNVGRSLGVMHPDGSGAHVIYTIPAAEIKDGCDYSTVRWSPDGSRIAFLRSDPGAGDCSLCVMNPDGSNAHRITTEAAGVWFETDFRWSPDGKTIAFDRWRGQTGNNDFVVQPFGIVAADGGVVRSVGPAPVSDGGAFEFSPDGKSIISLPATALDATSAGAQATVIDVVTGQAHQVPWSANSWPSWQRLAP